MVRRKNQICYFFLIALGLIVAFLESVSDDGLQIANCDENMVVNQGTSEWPLPQLTFHHVHGSNIQILRGGRVARRKESFCKGLAFSSR